MGPCFIVDVHLVLFRRCNNASRVRVLPAIDALTHSLKVAAETTVMECNAEQGNHIDCCLNFPCGGIKCILMKFALMKLGLE